MGKKRWETMCPKCREKVYQMRQFERDLRGTGRHTTGLKQYNLMRKEVTRCPCGQNEDAALKTPEGRNR